MKLSSIKSNPSNPRIIKDGKFKKLVESLRSFPEMMEKRPMVCVTDVDKKIYPLGGNMRFKAIQELGYKEIPDSWIIMADEWTSVVDRTVAKAMSHCIQKFARKHNKKIVLLSCHYDVLEWLVPDWLIDCNEQKFWLRENEDFFFKRRDKIEFEIREVSKDSWRYFSKYHYLSERLQGGEIYNYGLFINGKQIGYNCFANYVPAVKGKPKIFHFNRLVVHPDYNGLGIGIKFLDATCKIFLKKKQTCRILGKFSSIPTLRSLLKSENWRYLQTIRLMGKMKTGLINRNRRKGGSTGFREGGIKTYHFEWIGTKRAKI